jgi:hypothetical protein
MSELHKIISAWSSDADTTLNQRFNAIIDRLTPSRKWKTLEELTGITTHSWQKAYLGKQRPTADMLEALAQHWPQYAFWMMTGITHLEAMHRCPIGSPPWPSSLEDQAYFETINDRSFETILEVKKFLREHAGTETEPSKAAGLEDAMDELIIRMKVDATLREAKLESERWTKNDSWKFRREAKE